MIGLKCDSCGSYNTSRSGNEEIPAESAEEEEEEDVAEESDDGVYNEEDRVRLTLLRQRLGAIIRQWEQPTEEERNDGDNNNRNHHQQENMFQSFVHQLQLFQGMLDDFSGRYNDSDSDESDLEDYSDQSSSNSERSSDEDDDNEGDRNDDEEESDIAIADSNSDDDPDADDEDDSSNASSPSYSYFSQPHPINLRDIYASGDCESNGDSNSSWETEEEEEVIGEVGTSTTDNMGDVCNAQRQSNDITRLSGSLGSVTLECQSGNCVCACMCVCVRLCVCARMCVFVHVYLCV